MTQLRTNTMRYGYDVFTLDKSGYIISKQPLDCTSANEILGFIIEKTIPVGSNIRVAFRIDENVVKITDQTFTNLPTQAFSTESILAEGNTVAELEALSSIPAFVGKKVYPIIAMISPPDVEVFPSLKLALRTKSNQDQYTKTEESGEYFLASEDVDLVDVSVAADTKSGGSVLVEASLYQLGAWSDWFPAQNAKGQKAARVKFRATYAVTALGVSSAKLERATVTYKTNSASVSELTAELITTTEELGGQMRYLRCLVKHDALKESRIRAYASFRNPPKKREKYQIGTGTGERKTFDLPDLEINHNTLEVFVVSQPVFDFEFNLETNQITLAAAKDAAVYASYSYDWGTEKWREMQIGTTQCYQNSAMHSTDFSYAIEDGEEAKGICAVKFVLEKAEGSVMDELIGVGTGGQQMFVLKHLAQPDSIRIPGTSFSIDENNILTVAAPKGQEIRITYDWISQTPILRGYYIAWNE